MRETDTIRYDHLATPEATDEPSSAAGYAAVEAEQGTWFRVDLHLHAHALVNANKETALLAILRKAAETALHIIGLVDHNSVRGYEQLRLETGRLAVLREAGRLLPDQAETLAEYDRLLARIILLPGFEITTQEGVGLVAVFSPDTSAERLNALLLNLGISMERLREAAAEIRAQADLPTAALLIAQAGGLVIADYNDVAQRLPGLDALPPEVHALEMAALPDALPALPRPAVWFSAAGCRRNRRTGKIGESYTEVLLPACSFEGLRGVLLAGAGRRLRFPEHERLRAYVEQLRQQGPDQVIFCGPETDPQHIYRDVAALANGGGGILIIGLTEQAAPGVANPAIWSTNLARSVREHIDPQPRLNLELLRYGDRELIRAEVHAELPPPYVTSEGIVYLRREGQTRPANRQELLEIIAANLPNGAAPAGSLDLPQAGVEIVGAYLRDGVWFYDVRDLRVTSGVTQQRAKGLWAYAIERQEELRLGRADLSRVLWKGDRGVWRAYRSGDRRVFDLLHRDPSGRIDHIFYGVSEWGLTPRWRDLTESVRPPVEDAGALAIEDNGEGAAHEAHPVRPAAGPPSRHPRMAGPRERVPDESAASESPTAALPPGAAAAAAPSPELPPAETTPAAEPPAAAAAAEAPPTPEPNRVAPPPARAAPSANGAPGERIPRWRGQAAVEHIYWDGNHLFFDLAMRQGNDQVRYYRRIHRNQLAEAEGWLDLVRVQLPTTGIEIVRCTAGGDEFLYQFRDPQSGRVDPRVRRKSDFSPDSPYAYAIQMHHQDTPLDEARGHWWGNIGYLRIDAQRVDLLYRDEEGRDHIYYAAERALLEGEWKEMLKALRQEA